MTDAEKTAVEVARKGGIGDITEFLVAYVREFMDNKELADKVIDYLRKQVADDTA